MAIKTHKRKKNSRQRGSGGHGWGAKKKHRGSGNRGGTGNAGSGKRGASKRFTIRFVREHFGKHGFIKKNPNPITAINIQYLEDSAERLIAAGKAKSAGSMIAVDLGEMGVDKLLSKGRISKKLKVKVANATANAIKKIEAAGGSVEVQHPPVAETGSAEAAEGGE